MKSRTSDSSAGSVVRSALCSQFPLPGINGMPCPWTSDGAPDRASRKTSQLFPYAAWNPAQASRDAKGTCGDAIGRDAVATVELGSGIATASRRPGVSGICRAKHAKDATRPRTAEVRQSRTKWDLSDEVGLLMVDPSPCEFASQKRQVG